MIRALLMPFIKNGMMDNVEDMQVLARKNWETRAKKLGLIRGKLKQK